MNAKVKADESYNIYLLLDEIEKDQSVSQRILSRKLGIAVGLVNSYMRNMVSKGYVRVKAFPRNRYSYLLTPKGFAEKSRLAYRHLNYFTSLYTSVRSDFCELFKKLESEGIEEVVFCGVDEVAEIAFLSLHETGIKVLAVMDDERQGKIFFGHKIDPLSHIQKHSGSRIVLTSLKKKNSLKDLLLSKGVGESLIFSVMDS